MKILITNDDGVDSPGVIELAKKLSLIGEVTIVAPDRQRSATSSALTLSHPLRVKEIHLSENIKAFSVDGNPADCVKLAVTTLLDFKPDLLVSGINHGKNTAVNVIYSGTVSGAIEGMIFNIPSIAISVANHDYSYPIETAANYSLEIVKEVCKLDLPNNTILNVNVPAIDKQKIRGVKVVSLSDTIWIDKYEKRLDPFGRLYYWFAGEYAITNKDEDTDDAALEAGWVTVTPLKFEFTNSEYLKEIKQTLNYLKIE